EGEPAVKQMRCDGAPLERLLDSDRRPLLSVFEPDRLELVKGPPAARRAHLDQLVAGLWPPRAARRLQYARVLAQRNALLARTSSARASGAGIDAWDRELARAGLALRTDRAAAVECLRKQFAERAAALGCGGELALAYRPGSAAS